MNRYFAELFALASMLCRSASNVDRQAMTSRRVLKLQAVINKLQESVSSVVLLNTHCCPVKLKFHKVINSCVFCFTTAQLESRAA